MSALITVQLPIEPKIHSVKQLTCSVSCNYWLITYLTKNQLVKISNTYCPPYILIKYILNPKSTQ